MKHSLSHLLRLVLARVRWAWSGFRYAARRYHAIRDMQVLASRQRDINTRFLVAQRQNPASRDTFYLQGQMELINDLINVNQRQEGQT
jgi:hypothetical protein